MKIKKRAYKILYQIKEKAKEETYHKRKKDNECQPCYPAEVLIEDC